MNANIVKIVKIGSMVASVAGMIGSAWSTSQENKETLAKLVAQQLKK